MDLLERAREWLETAELETSTLGRYESSLRLLAREGVVKIEDVTRPRLKRYLIDRRKAGAQPRTCNRDLAALCSFLGWLYDLGEFSLETLADLRTLFLRVDPPMVPDFFSPEQFKTLREACSRVSAILELAFSLAVHTGLRFEELRTLWYDDFVLEVDHAFCKVQRTHERKIKTKRERTPPIARAFANELINLGFTKKDGPIFPKRHNRRNASIYTSTSSLQRWFWRAQEIAGTDCDWITCRHTYASWLIQNNVSVAKVAKYLGNSIHVCYQHYGALVPGGDPEVERGFAALKATGT